MNSHQLFYRDSVTQKIEHLDVDTAARAPDTYKLEDILNDPNYTHIMMARPLHFVFVK